MATDNLTQQDLNQLRQQIKKKLHAITPAMYSAAMQRITTQVITSNVFIRSQNIACYIPIDNEIDTESIIKTIWQQRKNCYLPALDPNKKYHLQFVKFNKHDKLIPGKYKTQEPEIDPKKIIAVQTLDLVIVPLLGFTADYFRLGRGAGCYDRTFEFKKQNPKVGPYLLGIGYNWQCTVFKSKPWDVPMDNVFRDLPYET